MKTILPFLLLLSVTTLSGYGQITTPVIRANFGVDADIRSNYFNGFVQSGNDDWFQLPGTTGTGQFIIDTTGAAALVAGYSTNPASRRLPFYRNMRFPGYTVVNNRLLLDAVFIRDYHGDDSTVFASGANKNGDSPANWSCPVSQGIPDKNDILDMMVHVRRAGPYKLDSLWMFGGLSLDNTTGNRYFDFEMYQTDIYYNRGTRQFYGYGPDGGHTSWTFDAAGNITKPGDIIFSAEYQSSSLTNIEARIWVNRAALSITPVSFDWAGQFDGDASGSTFGYASIRPKGAGTYYTGLQSGNATWGGPFSIVLQNDAVVTDYDAKQYVEFSVNLTKLGLDPVTLLGSNSCGMPFRRILVKTRASNSFTSELKDFVGPFDFFLAPRVQALTNTPFICQGSNIAQIDVTNPVATSVYKWTTPDGTIISTNAGPTIFVNKPGTYIVTQYLQEGCSDYAKDTVQVMPLVLCQVLETGRVLDFRGVTTTGGIRLSWQVQNNPAVRLLAVEKSTNGINFTTVGTLNPQNNGQLNVTYAYTVSPAGTNKVHYRIKLLDEEGQASYSNALRFSFGTAEESRLTVFPNPVKNNLQVQVSSTVAAPLRVDLFNPAGQNVYTVNGYAQPGVNAVALPNINSRASGVCLLKVRIGEDVFYQKVLVSR